MRNDLPGERPKQGSLFVSLGVRLLFETANLPKRWAPTRWFGALPNVNVLYCHLDDAELCRTCQMIQVYGRRNSSSVQLVMWAVAELGLEHQRLDFGHGHASTRTDSYLKMNPMGRVPVVVDGEVCMFESAAILRYLAATYGADDFWPSDPARRAPLDTWAEWGKGTFTEAVLEVFVYDMRLSPKTRDPDILQRATAKLIPLAELLDQRIAKGPWLDGERFSFADIACGHILHRYYTLDWPRPELANLERYYENLQNRPAYRDHAMVSYEALRGTY